MTLAIGWLHDGGDTVETWLHKAGDWQRAFTLALRTYEDARRAVNYLRAREGDADTIIPSLYPGRPRRRPPEVTDPANPYPPSGAPGGTGSTKAGTPADANTTQTLPAVTPASAAAAAAAQRNAPASKDPFLQ